MKNTLKVRAWQDRHERCSPNCLDIGCTQHSFKENNGLNETKAEPLAH